MATLPRPIDGASAALLAFINQIGLRRVDIALKDADGDGFVAEAQNDSGGDRLIVGVVVDLTTDSTSAATLDIGVHATSETSNNTLLDGLDVGSATGFFNSVSNAGDNGGPFRKWAADAFVTVSEASGDADDMAGTVRVFYIDLPAAAPELTRS